MKKFYLYNLLSKNKNSDHVSVLPEIKHKKIAVVSPHADDIAIGCGGTMAFLSKTNAIIPLLFFTGERGVDAVGKEHRVTIREKEMQREAEILGLQNPMFLELSSYENDRSEAQTNDIVRIQQEFNAIKPDIIFLPHTKDCQPRHRLASAMALCAIKQAGMAVKLFFYETSWHPFGPLDFNVGVVLDADNMAKKLEAVRAHTSQIKRTRFDIAAESLARFRAVTVAEQRVGGYGSSEHMCFDYLEVFLTKTVRCRT